MILNKSIIGRIDTNVSDFLVPNQYSFRVDNRFFSYILHESFITITEW